MAAFLMNFSGLLWNGAENAAIALKNCSGKEPGLQNSVCTESKVSMHSSILWRCRVTDSDIIASADRTLDRELTAQE